METLRKQEEKFARDYLADAGYGALEGAIPNVPAFGTALAEGYGLSEVKAAGRYLEDIAKVMESLAKGLRSAERRRARQAEAEPNRSNKRGERER